MSNSPHASAPRVAESAIDAAQTAQAANSLEKMDAIDREGLIYTILVSETRPPLSAEVAAESEKSNCGGHAGHSSQRPAHENSEHKSEQEETPHPSQRPLPFQHGKLTSIEHGKYYVRSSANPKASQHRLTVRLDWNESRMAPPQMYPAIPAANEGKMMYRMMA